MSDKTANIKKRDAQKAYIVKKLAEKHGLSTRHIYRIVDTGEHNEAVFADYMTMKETLHMPVNLLLKAVENLVPFN